MTDLSGRVALVTGGSRGIGRGIVEQFAQAGCRVGVVATSEASAEKGVAAATAAGAEAVGFAADVRDGDRAAAVVGEVVERWGRLDILVNNAGVTRDGLLMRMADEDIDTVIDVNLKATLLWCRAVLKPMMKAKSGSIINVSSIVGLMGSAGQSNYAAAKAGIFGITRSLSKELGGRGIRVNAIAPGYIQTDMTSDLPDAVKEASLAKVPLGRFGDPEDIARAALFLAGDMSSYVTGTTLVVDGGMSL